MKKSQTKKPRTKPFLVMLGLFLIACLAAGVMFYHHIEKLAYVDALYLSAMTMTTVGYGDFAPQTTAGKLFTSAYAFLGVVTFLGFAAAIFQFINNRYHK